MIRFYYGTVGSGKSMHLIADYLNAKRRFPEKKIWLCKPVADTRTQGVYTRFGNMEVAVDYFIPDNVLDSTQELHTVDMYFVDEAQFVPEWFINTAIMYSYDWRFYGLRNDVNKKMWPSVSLLMSFAAEIIELPTICDICKDNKASFNKSIKKVDDPQNSLGFHFIPVCHECWYI